jgi:hypothetical protein
MTAVEPPLPPLELAAHLVNAAHAQLAHAERALFAALDIRAAQPGRKPGTCGTPAGLRRHQRAGEAWCPACCAAKRWEKTRTWLHRRRPSTG